MVGSGKCIDDNDVAEVVTGLGPGPNVGGEGGWVAANMYDTLGFPCGNAGYHVGGGGDPWRVGPDNLGLGPGVYQGAV